MQDWAIWHPFENLSMYALSWLGGLLSVAAVFLMIRLESLGRRLRTTAAPQGIVSLEMALSATESRHMISSWTPDVRNEAKLQLVFDYWFIPAYTTILAIVGMIAARWFEAKQLHTLSHLAIILSWGQWVVGLVDFAENSALLRMLQTYPEVPESLTHFVGGLARLKIFLFLAAVVAAMFAVAWMFR